MRGMVSRCRTALSAAALFFLAVFPALALIDFNHNGASDLWERQYNGGNLLASFDPAGDPDGDGWSNEREAVAGTDPFDGCSETGCLRPEVVLIPATYHDPDLDGIPDVLVPETASVTWPTLPGKLYSLHVSPDLSAGSWALIGEPWRGDGTPTGMAVAITQPDGSRPEKLFWRVLVEDTDSDEDLLTDAEEHALGTNPFSIYSDTDFLTDTLEVFEYLTDPVDPDSDDDGTPDHEEAIPETAGDEAKSKYAPDFRWCMIKRSLTYGFSSASAVGSLDAYASWTSRYNSTRTLSSPMTAEALSAALPPFPGADEMPGPSEFPRDVGGTYSEAGDYARTKIEDLQVRMYAEIPPELPTTRRVLAARFEGGQFTGFDAYAFTVPAGALSSTPKVISALGKNQSAKLYFPAFTASEGVSTSVEIGWDNSGPEVWRSVEPGQQIKVFLRVDGNGLTQAMQDRLEIVPTASSEASISISDVNWSANGCIFKIHGLAESSEDGASVVLCMKNNPLVVYDSMKVHVLPRRNVPVSIFRLHDSRDPATAVTGGPTDAAILEKLNSVYLHQGNIQFSLHPSSGIVDLRRDPKKAASDPDEPPILISGKLNPLPSAVAIQNLLNNRETPPAKLIIHIVNELLDPDMLGGTHSQFPRCYIRSSAPLHTYAHEVGHAFGLASKAVADQQSHDLGMWPAHWKKQGYRGMMHPYYDNDKSTIWLRQEDWWKANLSSKPEP